MTTEGSTCSTVVNIVTVFRYKIVDLVEYGPVTVMNTGDLTLGAAKSQQGIYCKTYTIARIR